MKDDHSVRKATISCGAAALALVALLPCGRVCNTTGGQAAPAAAQRAPGDRSAATPVFCPVRSSRATTAPGPGRAKPHGPAECPLAEVAEALSDPAKIPEPQWGVATCPSIGRNISKRKRFIESFHAVKDLGIFRSAVDYILYKKAGENSKAGSAIEELGPFKFTNAPTNFVMALEKLSAHSHVHRYPAFWQTFMWLFGGFILTDLQDQEFHALSLRTGIPVESIPEALDSYAILFPEANNWFRNEPNSNVRVMKFFPVPFMGIGANLRKVLYTESHKYGDLKVGGKYTVNDPIKWNNLTCNVLSG